jgi:tetratricopeptide (TPR) repeat protein
MTTRERVWMLGVALALAPAYARADADQDAAFQRGLELYAHGSYMDAIGAWEKLLASMGEQRGWKVLYNLGLAYEKVGDATHAIERLDAFVRRLAEQPGALGADLDERRQDALQRIRALKESNGALHVIAPPGDRVLVRIDAQPPRPADFTAYLAPGDHELETHLGTPNARKIRVKLEAGQSQDFRVPAPTPAPAPAPAPSPAAAPVPAPAHHPFPLGWALAGTAATLAAGAAPLVLGLRAASKRDDAAHLGAGNTQYESAMNDFGSARTAYYVSYAVPAAVLAVSIVVVLVKWNGTTEERTATAGCGGACARF